MPGITVTGIDERTRLTDIQRLLDAGAEVAVLWSETPEGRNRYPSVHWISSMHKHCRGKTALHVCGSKARERFLKRPGPYNGFAFNFDRIQINGRVDVSTLARCSGWGCEIITQDNSANAPLRDIEVTRHAILVDGSGGRGIAPTAWVRPPTSKRVGFAGGLGPHNLSEQLTLIAAVATGDWWVDMESGVRTDDWFDADKALECVRIFKSFTGRTDP